MGRTLLVRRYFHLAIVVMFFLFLCAMKSAEAADQKKSEVTGTIRISGAWALYPMMVKWGEEFQKVQPGVRIDVSAGGAGKGIADALAGMVDIGMVSRDIRPEEIKPGTTYVPVVKDAVFPTINANNPVLKTIMAKGVKKATFDSLWIQGKRVNWGEIAGTNSKDIVQVYTRSDSCGAAETWANYLGKKQEDLMGVGVYGDPGLADAVKKDALGIGYNNLNYAYDAKTGLPLSGIRIIPIDVNGNGKIDAAEDLQTKEKAIRAVMSGSYPSPPARDLYLITKENFKEPSRTFVRWILMDGQKYVDEVGYIKIAPKQIKESLKKLEK
jgi:phosphate transport system substrate-binding protein